jgi:hypothetical protein
MCYEHYWRVQHPIKWESSVTLVANEIVEAISSDLVIQTMCEVANTSQMTCFTGDNTTMDSLVPEPWRPDEFIQNGVHDSLPRHLPI